jgi:hypothetical protein
MSTISLHNLDKNLDQIIRKKAQASHMSLNKFIQSILKKALGSESDIVSKRRKYFQKFCGGMSKEELDEFNANIADLEKIDRRDWL